VLSQAIASGIMLGGLFALISIGLTLIWGVMKIINFAQGEFLMVGLYLAYFLVAWGHIDPYITILVTVPFMFFFGIGIFRATISPILKDPVMNQIMLTLGVSLILQNLALMLFSANVQSVHTRYATWNIHIGPVVISAPQLIALFGSVICTLAVWYFLKTTASGRAIRASAQNPTAATLMGIDVPRTYMLAVGISSATLGFAASLMIPFYYTSPTVGVFLSLIMFIVIILGGIGNYMGCLLGGLIIGLAEAVGAAVFPGSLSRVFMFTIFILFLLFRPQGILSRRPT